MNIEIKKGGGSSENGYRSAKPKYFFRIIGIRHVSSLFRHRSGGWWSGYRAPDMT